MQMTKKSKYEVSYSLKPVSMTTKLFKKSLQENIADGNKLECIADTNFL